LQSSVIELESSVIAFLLVKTELESSLIIIVTSNNWIRELSNCNSY